MAVSKKISALPSLAGAQVGSDVLTALDVSQLAALQNVKTTLDDFFGNVPSRSLFNPAASATPTNPYFGIRTPADTALTADTERVGIQLGGSSVLATVTRQWTAGGGAFTTQREILAVAPTYGATGAETITNSATFAVTGPPIAGTNMTLTNTYSVWVQSGKLQVDGIETVSPAARSGTAPIVFQIVTPADTALTASAESILNQFGGSTSQATVTRQFATGTITNQRENLFVAPTYGFVGASAITNAATVAITAAPIAGTNATLTNGPYALWVQSGYTRLDGQLTANGTLSTRIDIDASTFNSFPSMDVWLGTSNAGRVREGQESIFGTRDITVQPIPDSTSGYGFIESFNSAGLVVGTGGNTNPIVFSVNRVRVAQLETASFFYLGNGVTSATPAAGTLNGTGGSGTNIAGAPLDLAGGKGSGNADPGYVALKYPLRGATGTTLQSLSSNRYPVSTCIFTQTADQSVNNTTAETTLFGSGSGTLTIEAGMARVGQNIRIRIFGSFTTTGTPTVRIRLYVGATNVADSGAVTSAISGANGRFEYQADMTIRAVGASGNIYCAYSSFRVANVSVGGTQTFWELLSAGAPSVDWTAAKAIDVTITWGTMSASNNATSFNGIVEYHR